MISERNVVLSMTRKKSGNKKEVDTKKHNIKEKFTEMLELPKEIVLDMPKLTMLGNGDLVVENYKGIIEYEENIIRINTTSGIIKITGSKLYIKEITSENIVIYGCISILEFLK
jgi:sporulation protein YqfC